MAYITAEDIKAIIDNNVGTFKENVQIVDHEIDLNDITIEQIMNNDFPKTEYHHVIEHLRNNKVSFHVLKMNILDMYDVDDVRKRLAGADVIIIDGIQGAWSEAVIQELANAIDSGRKGLIFLVKDDFKFTVIDSVKKVLAKI